MNGWKVINNSKSVTVVGSSRNEALSIAMEYMKTIPVSNAEYKVGDLVELDNYYFEQYPIGVVTIGQKLVRGKYYCKVTMAKSKESYLCACECLTKLNM